MKAYLCPRQGARLLAPLLLAAAAVVLICCAGCTQPADRDILKARGSYHAAVDGYLGGIDEALAGLFERALADVARLEREALAARQRAFLDRHTDDGGGVVSARADGSIGPMPREQLEAFLAEAARQASAAEQRAANGRAVLAEFRAARERLRALTARLAAKEIEWQEAKESAQAEVNRIVGMLGTLAAGAAAGAAAVP